MKHAEQLYSVFKNGREYASINNKWGVGLYDKDWVKWGRKKGLLQFTRHGVGGRKRLTCISLTKKGLDLVDAMRTKDNRRKNGKRKFFLYKGNSFYSWAFYPSDRTYL